MADDFDVARLKKITSQMIDAITSPPFVDAMRKLRAVPKEKRLTEGARLLSPDNLRRQGAPLPADMRISSRYFEPGATPINVTREGATLVDNPQLHNFLPGGTPGTASIGGCACAGGLTFCGGAGGNT